MGSKLKSVEHQKEQVERDLAQTKKQLQQVGGREGVAAAAAAAAAGGGACWSYYLLEAAARLLLLPTCPHAVPLVAPWTPAALPTGACANMLPPLPPLPPPRSSKMVTSSWTT
jgi:hypothetical protein